jgi:PD-(D/E)XK nuclease superfamily
MAELRDETVGLTIRASSLAADCTLRWAGDHFVLRERIEAIAGPLRKLRPHIGGVVGGGAHAGFAELNKALRDTGEVGGAARERTATEAAVHEVDQRYDQAGGEILQDDVTESQDRAREQVEGLTRKWHERQTPTDAPVLVEQGMSGKVAGVHVTGTPDRWMLSGKLSDTKSGKRPPRPDTHGAQLGTYSMLLRARNYPVSGAELIWMPRTKMPRPIETVPVDLEAAERTAYARIRFLSRVVQDFEAAIDGDLGPWWKDHPIDVIPTNPASFLCSPDFCRLYGTEACQAWKLKP